MTTETTDRSIIVRALSRSRVFSGLDELADHVKDILEHRGGIFTPFELAAISELARRANGEAPPQVHRIARATTLYTPPRPERGPTSLDADIEAQEAIVEAVEVEWIEARQEFQRVRADLDRRIAKAKARGGSARDIQTRVGRVNEGHAARLQDAKADLEAIRKKLVRARARLNARWHPIASGMTRRPVSTIPTTPPSRSLFPSWRSGGKINGVGSPVAERRRAVPSLGRR